MKFNDMSIEEFKNDFKRILDTFTDDELLEKLEKYICKTDVVQAENMILKSSPIYKVAAEDTYKKQNSKLFCLDEHINEMLCINSIIYNEKIITSIDNDDYDMKNRYSYPNQSYVLSEVPAA